LPVAFVAKERGARRLFLAQHGGEGRAVEQVNISAPVIVIIEDGDSARRRLQNVIFTAAACTMRE
jgi:hypothetical protein